MAPRAQKPLSRLTLLAARIAMTVLALIILIAIPQYRWPEGEREVVSGEIQLHAFSFWMSDPLRNRTELLLGRRPLLVKDVGWFYVSREDFNLCWPEPYSTMREKSYTFEVTLDVQTLKFHDMPLARLVRLDTLRKAPSYIK